ncbi:MAG TPA: formate dehydrogenase subunit alpha [Dehalococcoidia bacterium]|nr:formate dehydrogenase subunit alpha [Dehalococcoidia bacterium]
MVISLSVDGVAVEVRDGATLLDAVLAAGAHVPHLCKDPDQRPIGACRTCMVEVDGQRGLRASCHTPAFEGAGVRTRGDALDRVRRTVLELTAGMVDGHVVSARGGVSAELRGALARYGIDGARYAALPRRHLDDSNPFYLRDLSACILCGRCVTACQDVQHIGAIAIAGRGREGRIAAAMDRPISESICTSCGQCVSVCPTGALTPKPAPLPEIVREVESTCPYCGVGCGVRLQIDADEHIAAVADEPANLSSQGMLCVKGRFGTSFVHHPDRLTQPLIRRDGELRPATWDEALDLVAAKVVEHRKSFAALASAKCTNEDNYVFQKFVRAVMGTNNIDHCSRLCHGPSVTAMMLQIGSGATSNSYQDYEDAGCLMVVGSDTSSNHPVIASRLRRAIDTRGTKLVVVNPMRIDLCDYTDMWLRPHPGTDVALFNSMARAIVDEGLEDGAFIEARTDGYDAWRASLAAYAPEEAERTTGVPAELVRRAARAYARPPFSGSCLLWGMGVTQHTSGTDNAHALVNLMLATGQVGRRGSGISPLRGQNNVQGCGDAGCLPNTLPGMQGLEPEVVRAFEAAWGAELPAAAGLTSTEMIELAAEGKLDVMYIVGENPLLGEPFLAHAEEGIERLKFLAVQEIFMTETAQRAHVVLPSATFAEKEGTFTNSERRVQRVRQAVSPPGQARADWAIVCEVANRVARLLGREQAGFSFDNPAAIFDEMASVWPAVAGISHARLDREGGIQWPCPTADHPGTGQLFGDTFPSGCGRFVAVTQGPPAAELPSRRFPFILSTGRVLYHWHGGTMTRRVKGLLARSPVVRVAIHPEDAAEQDVANGERVVVSSRRGELPCEALVTEAVPRGELFVPFVKLAESAANFLTNAVYDPKSKIPEYKVCAVRIDKPGAVRRGRGERVRTPFKTRPR